MVAPQPSLDLESIVYGFDRETAAVDYKAAAGWNELGRRGQRELIKDLMAFSNSDAVGYLVIGVNEGPSGTFDPVGLSAEQAASYDPTPIGELVRTYADPEVQFTIHVPELRGKSFLVLRVAPFATVPHICKQSYNNILEQGAIYVRTDNAQSIKVPTAQHMRRLVERATFNQRDSLLAQIRSLVESARTPAPPSAGTQGFREQLRRLLGR